MLDTHALIWALEGSPRLSKTARKAIESHANEVLVSAVSAWEIAIKKRMGRLYVPDDLIEAVDEAGFARRALGLEAAQQLESLPSHHNDPFDRMLIAHSLVEQCTLVTRDEQIALYPVKTLW